MMRILPAFICAIICTAVATLAAAAAGAGAARAITDQIIPGYDRFARETQALSDSATLNCRAEAVQPAFMTAFDAWMGVSHLHLGPVNDGGALRHIAFWPDTDDAAGHALRRLIADQDPAIDTLTGFAELPDAARGLFALERLLFDPALSQYSQGDYTCALVQSIAHDLARTAAQVRLGWQDGYAEALLSAGTQADSPFQSPQAVDRLLFTQIAQGLEFNAQMRLGRPLGTYDHPRPARAESHLSKRSLRNLTLSLEALRGLTKALSGGAALDSLTAFDRALNRARRLNDADFSGVATPEGRFRIEALQTELRAVHAVLQAELGATLDHGPGTDAQTDD